MADEMFDVDKKNLHLHPLKQAFRKRGVRYSNKNFLERGLSQSQQVVELYLSGYSMRQISEDLRIPGRLISIMINGARDIWHERYAKASAELINEQLAKIDRAEIAAWDGWHRSIEDAVEEITGTKDTEKGPMSHETTKKKRQSGNSEFLKVALSCVEQRCKLLGLNSQDNEKKAMESVLVVVNSPDEVKKIVNFSQINKTVDGDVEIVEERSVESADDSQQI